MTKHLKTHWRACGLALIAATAQLAFTAPVQAQAQAAPDTLAKVRSEGVIRLGVRDNAAPFAYVDAKGKPGGFTWEVCRALVKNLEAELGRPIEIKVVPNAFAAPFDLLKDGRIDMQCGATTHSAERAKQADFSNTFFVSGIAVAYRKEDVQYANSLKFGRVAVLANSTAAKIMERRMGAKGSASIDTMVPVKNYEEGVAKLKAKEADTLFADSVLIPLDPAIDRRRSLETVEPYALMMRKGDRAFVDAVDRALMKVLSGPQARQFATDAKLDGRLNILTTEAWRRGSKEPAPQMY
jgi:glutamate/aspartate transport system substrate-binding protein